MLVEFAEVGGEGHLLRPLVLGMGGWSWMMLTDVMTMYVTVVILMMWSLLLSTISVVSVVVVGLRSTRTLKMSGRTCCSVITLSLQGMIEVSSLTVNFRVYMMGLVFGSMFSYSIVGANVSVLA